MTFKSIGPKTNPIPYPFFDPADADQLRGIALEIEDVIYGKDEFVWGRPGLIFLRSALMDLADRIDRE